MDEVDVVSHHFRDDRKKAVQKLSHLIYTSNRDPKVFREKLDAVFYAPLLPHRVEYNEFFVDHVLCEMLAPRAYLKKRIIFYVHGGSFIGGSSKAWRTFCASLANECAARLVIPNYRLAPTCAFPIALEDIQRVFRSVFNQEYEREANLEFIIAADSSGASLALALLLNLKEQIRQNIKCLVLFSPWVDLSSKSAFYKAKKNNDQIISGSGYRRSAELYTYASNLTNPLVSPIYALEENFRCFPPVYIQMGGNEILLQDIERFCNKLKNASVTYILDICENMMHMFQMADEYLADSHLAIERVGKYIKK